MKALLLVDIQRDFLPGGALAVNEGDKIIPIVNRLTKQDFDLIIASKDWHPPNHGSFADTHGREIGDYIQLDEIDQILWPVHCVEDTEGSMFAEELDTSAVDKIFYKGIQVNIDSYSTFFDNEHKRSTGLDHYLKEKGIRKIYIAGLATDYCVKYSVLDAVKLGYDVYVIRDACRAVNLNRNDEEKAIKEMRERGAKIIESKELLGS